MQGCHQDLKLPGKYNKGITLIIKEGNPRPPALNDSPAGGNSLPKSSNFLKFSSHYEELYVFNSGWRKQRQ